MGDIADDILEGLMCEGCGIYFDDGLEAGYPRRCKDCKKDERRKAAEFKGKKDRRIQPDRRVEDLT